MSSEEALFAVTEIATEMSGLVLEMRDSSQNANLKKKRLEMLAENFLRMTGQGRERNSITSIQSTNRAPGGVVVTM
jgi:hypothetical protein